MYSYHSLKAVTINCMTIFFFFFLCVRALVYVDMPSTVTALLIVMLELSPYVSVA